jgi:hypothetical protein
MSSKALIHVPSTQNFWNNASLLSFAFSSPPSLYSITSEFRVHWDDSPVLLSLSSSTIPRCFRSTAKLEYNDFMLSSSSDLFSLGTSFIRPGTSSTTALEVFPFSQSSKPSRFLSSTTTLIQPYILLWPTIPIEQQLLEQ